MNPEIPVDYYTTRAAIHQMFPKLAGSGAYMNDLARRASIRGTIRPPVSSAAQTVLKPLTTLVKKAGFADWVGRNSSTLSHGAELAGLGVLARPSINHLRGKEMSEKSKAIHETAGLGILAAPSAIGLGHHIYEKLRPTAKALTHV